MVINMKKVLIKFMIWVVLLLPVKVKAADMVREQYEKLEEKFQAIRTYDDISEMGYRIIEEQVFSEVFESFGKEPVLFVPAKDKKYNRMSVFIVDADGRVLFKTNQLETNYQAKGVMRQPTREIAAVSFIDVNQDMLKDIVLITRCKNSQGAYKDKKYKVGDVLFQKEKVFYRDYRISEKINRFSMNKSAKCIISYVRDSKSTEFLYTATTIEELLEGGLQVINEQSYPRSFEKLGKLQVVPGTYSMGDYDVFMVYLINEQGDIVWSFQPMEDYDSLYSLRGISCKDVDGDGMKDIVVLGRYSYEEPDGNILVESACSIYYQRTGGFDTDTEFRNHFVCTDAHKLDDVIREIRAYWGWQLEEVSTKGDGKLK